MNAFACCIVHVIRPDTVSCAAVKHMTVVKRTNIFQQPVVPALSCITFTLACFCFVDEPAS